MILRIIHSELHYVYIYSKPIRVRLFVISHILPANPLRAKAINDKNYTRYDIRIHSGLQYVTVTFMYSNVGNYSVICKSCIFQTRLHNSTASDLLRRPEIRTDLSPGGNPSPAPPVPQDPLPAPQPPAKGILRYPSLDADRRLEATPSL